ncbi:helix-turn-helix domain-containing protein [Microbulbifer sp. OS29]|uniref:Helix-turn-helix domain-containing protein n=1 Tax=Microbulbifer okhotskensis TaxID=2926617 RepID=A0A9X2J7B8_9GAMM|nr:helix-turn-helix domain-containing protein [Microbulbifer okhotskensis]MCO1336404.1 helix-turn-helix domain-containing protein [Microbulbifer okhotskensis]
MSNPSPFNYPAQRAIIAGKLREIRISKGIETRNLSAKLNIRSDTLSQIELGKQRLPSELLPAWCEVLEVSIDSVFQIEKPKQREERKRRKECESYVETFSKLSPEYRDLVLKHLKMVADIDRSKG